MRNNKKKKKNVSSVTSEISFTESAELSAAEVPTNADAVQEDTAENVTVLAHDDTATDANVDALTESAPNGENNTSEAYEAKAETEAETVSVTEEPQKKKNPKQKSRSKGDISPIRLIVTLTVICVVIAVMLGGVNLITRKKIADAAALEKSRAILSVFKGGSSSRLHSETPNGDEIHVVYKNKDILGYCVFTTASGFGGDIEMIVGIDTVYNTKGVKIISMSETPGVGTKTNTVNFLSRFAEKSHSSPTDGVDAIAGATISSEAIMAGVLSAHEIKFDLETLAEKEGVKLILPEDDKSDDEADTDNPESSTDSLPESAPADTDESTSADTSESITPSDTSVTEEPTEETSDIPFVENGENRYYVYGIGVGTSYDRYVIELTKEEEDSDEDSDPIEIPSEPAPITPATEPLPITPVTTPPASLPAVTTPPEESTTETAPIPEDSSNQTTESISQLPEPTPSEESSAEPEPTPPESTDTEQSAPVSPDTSDPEGEKDPVVRPGIDINIPSVN